MAASTIGAGSSGRRRTLDAEINLVPFIDLLSMCICFLLMTAVWTQLGSLQVKQANGTEAAASHARSLDLEAKFVSPNRISLALKGSGKSARVFDVAAADVASLPAALDAQLRSVRSTLRSGEEIGSVMLTPRAGVDYGTLVSVMDVFRKNQLVNLGVVPVNPNAAGGS